MPLNSYLGRMHKFLGRSTMITRIAVKARNQASAVISAHFSDVDGPAENGEYALIDLIAPDADNFIDVGGNVGEWSARFLSRMTGVRQGLIVDANSDCVHTLRKRFGEYRNVRILDAALSDYSGNSRFFEAPGSASALSTLTTPSRKMSAVMARSVRVTTLDDEVAALGWDRVSMLKIDAEGHDLFVLRGARQLLSERKVDFVQFECNSTWYPVGVSIVAANAFLESVGYRIFQLAREGLRTIDIDYYGSCGSANWVAIHDRSPERGLRLLGSNSVD